VELPTLEDSQTSDITPIIEQSKKPNLKITLSRKKKLKTEIITRVLKQLFLVFQKEIKTFNWYEVESSGGRTGRSKELVLGDFLEDPNLEGAHQVNDKLIRDVWNRIEAREVVIQVRRGVLRLLNAYNC
jgi:hypothetical protein